MDTPADLHLVNTNDYGAGTLRVSPTSSRNECC